MLSLVAELSAPTSPEMLCHQKTGMWGWVMRSSDRNTLKPPSAVSLLFVRMWLSRGFDFCLSCRAGDPSAGAGGACTGFPGWNKVLLTQGLAGPRGGRGESQGNEAAGISVREGRDPRKPWQWLQRSSSWLELNYSIKTELRELHSSAIDTWRKLPCRKLGEDSVSDNSLINY